MIAWSWRSTSPEDGGYICTSSSSSSISINSGHPLVQLAAELWPLYRGDRPSLSSRSWKVPMLDLDLPMITKLTPRILWLVSETTNQTKIQQYRVINFSLAKNTNLWLLGAAELQRRSTAESQIQQKNKKFFFLRRSGEKIGWEEEIGRYYMKTIKKSRIFVKTRDPRRS